MVNVSFAAQRELFRNGDPIRIAVVLNQRIKQKQPDHPRQLHDP